MKMKWYELVRERMNALGVTREEIGNHLGKTPGAIGHWLLGRREPSLTEIAAMFKCLGIEHVTLNSDGNVSTELSESLNNNNYSYPLLTSVQAGNFCPVDGQYSEKDAKRWISTNRRSGQRSFWLEVKGHSMTAPQGGRPSFPEGMLILVDPDREVNSGDFCIAGVDGDNDTTFKRYVKDGGIEMLVPLNPAYPVITYGNDCHVIGKVVHSMWENIYY